MDEHQYHSYLFFSLNKKFYRLTEDAQASAKKRFLKTIVSQKDIIIESYITEGLKVGTSFMLWLRAQKPEAVNELTNQINRLDFGELLNLSYSYFGIARASQYSGRLGNPEQTIQNFTDRLPYFIVYPFTKTTEWHQLDFETRRKIMGEHVKVGLGYSKIRQCLLYSYGVDDYEFVVSYETDNLERFQDLVIDMRHTKSRLYTLTDVPIFLCIYKPIKELMTWL